MVSEWHIPEKQWVHTPDGGGYWESRGVHNHFEGNPKGTVVVRNYHDRTGNHYYDADGNELFHNKGGNR